MTAWLGWGAALALTAVVVGQWRITRAARHEHTRLSARLELTTAELSSIRRSKELADAGVRLFTKRFVAASEAAYAQTAAELHDAVAQPLMLARFALSQVPVAVGGPSLPGFDAASAVGFVEDAESAVRALMTRVRSPHLDDGLESALENLVAELDQRYGTRVKLQLSGAALRLSPRDAVTAYRFVQEALMNVVKHAEVDDAEVTVELDERLLQVEVSDQGVGFDPAAVHPRGGHHVGLELLRDRAAALGGIVTVDSSPGVGTRVALRLLVLPE